MNGDDNRRLAEALLKSDSEEKVIELLKNAGYWDRPELWRHYGDVENNWGQGGNQQSLAEAALAEKIVNSVDAALINKCHMQGIDPKSADAPRSIRSAVAQFFEGSAGNKIATGGLIEEWSDAKTREVGDHITLCATGVRPAQLNITIADYGEGQSATRLPDTILSLNKSNKMYVPFVQGQFNQGGTGALRFCGSHNLQLVISKRNPDLLEPDASEEDCGWCFTIVRRERPAEGRKNSIYIYLAPVGVGIDKKNREGGVLSFPANSFAIFPDDNGPYHRKADYGTAVKLYDYKFLGEKSNILRGKSLLSRLDLLLPEIALPVRFYEYRTNKDGSYLDVGSRRTTMSGLLRRIKNSPNVESGFPVAIPLQPLGEKLIARIFAFVPEGASRDVHDAGDNVSKKKLGGVRGYRKREGILLLRNGQTQGSLPKDFFRRDAVKMRPLADELMIFVECDQLSDAVREDLFMPSRDRVAENDFKQALVDALEKTVRDCQELKNLRNRRQHERMSARLKDEQPLTDVLQSLIKSSPNLTTLLQLGQRISAPFNTQSTGATNQSDFKGEVYPTYFKNKGVEYGTPAMLSRPINHRVRLTFETDARNDYFTRSAERGSFDLTWIAKDGSEQKAGITGPNLNNGIATAMLDFPEEADVGDRITFISRISDSRGAFENRIFITVQPPVQREGSGSGRRKPPDKSHGKERERPMEVAPPMIKRVYREHWEAEGFDEFTAMKVEHVGYSEDESAELYEFKINMDNTPLENESKLKRLGHDQYKLLREQFLYANVLVGLSLFLDDKKTKDSSENVNADAEKETVEERIERMCRALAPFIPALVSLGTSDLDSDDQVEGLEETG
jgi:hypothetical protein